MSESIDIRIRAVPDLQQGLAQARKEFAKLFDDVTSLRFGAAAQNPLLRAAAAPAAALYSASRVARAYAEFDELLTRINVQARLRQITPEEATRQIELATPLIGTFRQIQDSVQLAAERMISMFRGIPTRAEHEMTEQQRAMIRALYLEQERGIRGGLLQALAGIPGTDPREIIRSRRQQGLDEFRRALEELPSALRDFREEERLRSMIRDTYDAMIRSAEMILDQARQAIEAEAQIAESEAAGLFEQAESLRRLEARRRAGIGFRTPEERAALDRFFDAQERIAQREIAERIYQAQERARIAELEASGNRLEAERRARALEAHQAWRAARTPEERMAAQQLAEARERIAERARIEERMQAAAALEEAGLRIARRPLEASLRALRERGRLALRGAMGDPSLERGIRGMIAAEEWELLREEALRRSIGGGGPLQARLLGPGVRGLVSQAEIRQEREQLDILERIHQQLLKQYGLWQEWLTLAREAADKGGGFVIPP